MIKVIVILMSTKTKIIATVGPATLAPEIFKKIVEEGVDIIRLNTSYGSEEQFRQLIAQARQFNLPILYDLKEEKHLDFFQEEKLPWLAVSFTSSAQQLRFYRSKVPEAFLIAKIESVAGVENFSSILPECDAVMIARGDLAEAESIEKVPPLQKELAHQTKKAGKFLITATEMLLSMTAKPTPEIAEVSDIANAVFDGSDAVMLSEETAVGKYPVEAVRYMQKTVAEAEKWLASHHESL